MFCIHNQIKHGEGSTAFVSFLVTSQDKEVRRRSDWHLIPGFPFDGRSLILRYKYSTDVKVWVGTSSNPRHSSISLQVLWNPTIGFRILFNWLKRCKIVILLVSFRLSLER